MMMILVLGLLAAACGNEAGVDGAERQMEEAFLAPLAMAGLDFEVVSACHLGESEVEKWQFETVITISASSTTVTNALRNTVDVIREDREPMIVQQFAGQPGQGWDGVLETTTPDTSTLGLTRSNVAVDSDRPSVAWMPICDL
ncbi:MAG: hypothetical protein GY788_14775 [bacterium]|nr:hypothetical protein [bacterium]